MIYTRKISCKPQKNKKQKQTSERQVEAAALRGGAGAGVGGNDGDADDQLAPHFQPPPAAGKKTHLNI